MSAIDLIYKSQKANNKVVKTIYRKLTRFLYSCEYTTNCFFEDNVALSHNGLGCVIWAKKIGQGTTIWQNVTIGSGKGEGDNIWPKIGKNCKIYTGAVVIGNITVGDGAVIGANAVVTKDVPPNAVVGGVPAKVIKYLDGKK